METNICERLLCAIALCLPPYFPHKDNPVWSTSYKIENLSSMRFDYVHVSNAMEMTLT